MAEATNEQWREERWRLLDVIERAKWTMAAAAAWFYENIPDDDETDLQDEMMDFSRWIHDGMVGELPRHTMTGQAFFDDIPPRT